MRQLLFIVLLFSFACGESTVTDLCKDTICLQGVCDPQDGTCSNPTSCDSTIVPGGIGTPDTVCITGFLCEDDKCVADIACDDNSPCDRGQCFDGACINFDSCTEGSNCLENYACESGACVFDRCADVDCERGVCDVQSGACVNEEVCTSDNQIQNCIDGFFCYGQACTEKDTICADLNCGRGICDPEKAECANDPNCVDDNACLENFFCAEGCQENKCVDGMCARGICEQETGLCINKEPCQSVDECADGFLCVENACLEIAAACGETGCPGNQICEYSAPNLTATCFENTRCTRSIDCIGTRTCQDNACEEAGACVADALEPNDDLATASRISKASDNFLTASLCENDTDVFVYDVNDSTVFSGTLVVSLQVDELSIGNGSVTLKVESPTGEIKEVATTSPDSNARVEFPIGALNRDDYIITVSDDALEIGGVVYSVYAEVIEDTLSQSCLSPTVLNNGDMINGNTALGSSFTLGSSCTSAVNLAAENIYEFTIPRKSSVQISVDAEPNIDLSFSIRRVCENSANDLACVNRTATGAVETFNGFLEGGSYYLIVQGASSTTGGPYALSFVAEETICEFGGATCTDANTSRFCNAKQTGFETRTCDDGCDAGTGFCVNEIGEACENAIDATQGYSGSIIFSSYTDDYQVPVGTCIPGASTSTDGPDVAYFVRLEPQKLLSASLSTNDIFENSSIYLVTQCSDIGTSCLDGSSTLFSSNEEITYKNETQSSIDLFIIADVEQDPADFYGPTTIDIRIEDLVCVPGSTQCAQNNIETCNDTGTAYTSLVCTSGCNAGTGTCEIVPNDTCGSATVLTAPMSITGRIGEFSNQYSPPASCTGRSAIGRDAVYSFSTPDSGKVAQLRVDAQFNPSLYVVEDCDMLGDTCVIGADSRTTNDDEIEFLVNPNTTYYVIVDASSSQSITEFTLSFDLTTPSCNPNEIIGCANGQQLSFCSSLGVPRRYDCSNGCSNDICALPDGDTCFEAIPATTGVYSGNFLGTNDIQFTDLNAGTCTLASAKGGSDTIYEISLNAGESLFANITSNIDVSLYLMNSCSDNSSCLTSQRSRNPSLTYTASQNESVFLVVDRDSTFPSGTTFELEIRAGAPDCSPGAPAICDATNTKIEFCDGFGFSQSFDCTGTCTFGRCDVPSGDECIDAIPILSGETKNGTFSTNNPSYSISGPQEGACRMSQQITSIGRDTAYSIDLNPGDLLEVELTTTLNSAFVYIVQDCEDLSTCLAINHKRGAGKIRHLAETSGTVFIVVDASSTFSSSAYSITPTIRTGLACVPEAPYCDTGNVEICNVLGTGPSAGFSCAGGCVNGSCALDANTDLCTSAPTTNGIHIYDSFSNHTNDIDAGFTCTGTSTNGPDTAYKFELVAGEVFHAVLESFGKETSSIYMIQDCLDASGTCLVGDRNDFDTGLSEIHYLPTQNETVTIVVDSSTSADDPFSLLIESIPVECTAATTPLSCVADTIQYCSPFGLLDNFDCDGRCTNGVCQNPSGSTCIDPVVISSSQILTNQRFEASNEIELFGLQGACDSQTATNGFEKIYTIELDANETIDIDYNSQSSSTVMYLLNDCLSGDSCVDTTSTASRTGSLSYTATSAETLFLVLDRTTSPSTSLSFSLDLKFRKPCQVSDLPTCADATTIEGCASDGFTIQASCQGACTNGSCDVPNGQFCQEAIVMQDGSSDFRTFGTGNTLTANGVQGVCNFPSPTIGQDNIYRVDLLANDTLVANYTSNDSTAMIYALSDCGDFSSCLAQDAGGTGTLTYTALVDETLFLVMDRTGTSTRNYTLNTSIRRPNCTIGDAPTCSLADEVSYCVDQVLQTSSCIGCVNGVCPTVTGNSCADAIPATSGVLIQGAFDGDDTLTMAGNIGLCSFANATEGVDKFYEISLLAGQTLTGTYASNSSLAVIYVMGSCFETTTCYDNSATGNSGTITYTAAVDETVTVVMDRTAAGNAPSFTYDLSLNVN